MLTELIDRIDSNIDLMMNLAEQLGKLSHILEEAKNAVALLKPLELISASDDSIVRDKAVESLNIIVEKLAPSKFKFLNCRTT
jgi:serine/threonine-protein phosphatase 2A regulatory subunit A